MSSKSRMPALVLLLLFCAAWPAGAEDWEPCHQALQTLRSAARRASLETLEASRKDRQLQECLRQSNQYRGYSEYCEKLKGEYQRRIAEMKAALADLRSAVSQAEKCCPGLSPSETDGK